MTTITRNSGRRNSQGQPLVLNLLAPVMGLAQSIHSSWKRRQTMRALEALPADTLKDIGWPTTDNKRMRIVRK
ncbi:DUF1127 domain-containing protein [Agrobacterium larrymoorei]|uniref:DUF1127 domain-containing protein n=1 Tax=Agrobacterium larrymoorei TaxID=160699 RepID=UPI001573A69E|nr:DUF1127 domain-containing protein [Agrobacterium larrymoorei]NTJ42415.1 DUF1127 domain-containing protein [Agrobacterium larrymoorei]